MSNKLKHYQNVQSSQLKHLSEQADIYMHRAKSVALRKEILDKQRTRNYQTEYDRIRAHLADSAVPFATRHGVTSRKSELERLGARAFGNMI